MRLRRLALMLALQLVAAAPAFAVDVLDVELKNRGPIERAKLSVGGFVQPRFRWQPPDPDHGSAGFTGFTVQRARLEVAGALLSDPSDLFGFSARAKFSLELAGKNGAELQDAQLDLGFGNFFQFRFGQFKVPVHRANLVSDQNNLFPDRNRITQFAGVPFRDIGVMYYGWWGKRQVQWEFGVWNGEGQNRLPANKKFLYAGRVVVAPWGSPGDDFEILRDWNPDGVEQRVPVIAAGYSLHTYQDGSPGSQQWFLGHNVELYVHYRWLTLLSECFDRKSNYESDEVTDFRQYGVYVQAGLFPPEVPWAQDHLAVMGRFEQGDEFIPAAGSNVPPTGGLDPAQAVRRESVGLGIYAGRPMFRFVQDLRFVVSYTFKQELEGFPVDDDELNAQISFSL